MINNKKKKVKREKKKIEYRTKQERQDEIRDILIQITHFNLDMTYEPVKLLYKNLKNILLKDKELLLTFLSRNQQTNYNF